MLLAYFLHHLVFLYATFSSIYTKKLFLKRPGRFLNKKHFIKEIKVWKSETECLGACMFTSGCQSFNVFYDHPIICQLFPNVSKSLLLKDKAAYFFNNYYLKHPNKPGSTIKTKSKESFSQAETFSKPITLSTSNFSDAKSTSADVLSSKVVTEDKATSKEIAKTSPDSTYSPSETPDKTNSPSETPDSINSPSKIPDSTYSPSERPDSTYSSSETPDSTYSSSETRDSTYSPSETPDKTNSPSETLDSTNSTPETQDSTYSSSATSYKTYSSSKAPYSTNAPSEIPDSTNSHTNPTSEATGSANITENEQMLTDASFNIQTENGNCYFPDYGTKFKAKPCSTKKTFKLQDDNVVTSSDNIVCFGSQLHQSGYKFANKTSIISCTKFHIKRTGLTTNWKMISLNGTNGEETNQCLKDYWRVDLTECSDATANLLIVP